MKKIYNLSTEKGMSYTIKKNAAPCKILAISILLSFCVSFASGASTTYYSRASGNWNDNNTWSLTSGGVAVGSGIYPVAGDFVNIEQGFTVTVNIPNAACTSIQIGGSGNNGSGTLDFATSGNPSLTLTGNIQVGGYGNTNRTGTIFFRNGSSLTAVSIILGNSNSTPAPGIINMANGGTLTTGSFSVNTVTGNTWTPGTGTVIMNANNTLPASIFTTFNNLQITGGTTTAGVTLTSVSTLSISSGTGFAIGAYGITVNGTTSISGTLTINNSTGTKIFSGLVTISSGGTWNNSGNSAVTFRGGITNSGTFTAGSGMYTFDTNLQSLTGTLSIPNVTVTTINLTNNTTLTVGSALSGSGGLIQAFGATLNIGGTSPITTLNTTNSGNTINYTGVAQTVHYNDYYNLNLSGSSTKTFPTTGNININGNITIASSVIAALGTGRNHSANIITLGGNGTSSGTWGSTSSSATNKTDTYFSTTGIITVTTSTCTTPTPTISGPASLCSGTSGNVYTTQSGMLSYQWSVSSGGTITAGAGTNTITVTWNTSGAQTVSVNYSNYGCWAASPTVYSVTVNPIPVINVTLSSSTYCTGGTAVSLTAAGASTYTWSPATGLNTTTGATVLSSPPTPTTYTVTGTSAQGCSSTANATVNVQTVTVSATANPTYVCPGDGVKLTAAGFNPGNPLTYTFGAGGQTGSEFYKGSPNNAWWPISPYWRRDGGLKIQYMFKASELTAAGFSAGNFTSVAFNVVSAGNTLQTFSIYMATTTLTDLSAGLYPLSLFTQTYGRSTVSPAAGINTYTLDSPFYWNGTDNLIIQVSWSNVDNGGTSSSVKYDDAGYTCNASYFYNGKTADQILGGQYGTQPISNYRPQTILGWLPDMTNSLTYVWNPGGLPGKIVTVNPTTTSTYTVTGTSSAGCSGSASVTANVVSTPMSGSYMIGTGAGKDFSNLTNALTAYNAGCISGPVTLYLTDTYTSTGETFPMVVKPNYKTTSINTLTIKPAAGATPTISGSVPNGAILKILNQYTIIDGSNIPNGTTRDLTINNTNTAYPSAVQFGSVGTTPLIGDIIMNTIDITGDQSGQAIIFSDAASMNPGYFSNIYISNNKIQNTFVGIECDAVSSSGNGNGLMITGNDLTTGILNYGIYVQGADGITLTKNTIAGLTSSNDVTNFVAGIWIDQGVVNGTISENTLTNIAFNGPTSATNSPYGILIQGQNSPYGAISNILISKNVISNVFTATNKYNPSGIAVIGGSGSSTVSGVKIEKNTISNIRNTSSTGNASSGVYLKSASASANTTVVNNMISNIGSSGNSTYANNGHGIAVNSGAGYNIYANSILMNSTSTNTNGAGIYLASGLSAGAVNLRSNIFDNLQSSGSAFSIVCQSAKNAFSSIDYNDYITKNTSFNGYLNGTTYTSLSNWQVATGQDVNSRNGNPLFVSTTAGSEDLHITDTNSVCNRAGVYIAGVSDDIDGDVRGNPPDMGADEFSHMTLTWTGNTDTDWFKIGNWSFPKIPSSRDDAIIPAGRPNYPIINQFGSAGCFNATIASGGKVTISPAKSLTIRGNLTMDGTEAMTLKSDNSGTASLYYGTLLGSGTAAVEKYETPSCWHYITSPISSALSGVFYHDWLRYYDELTGNWSQYIIPTTVVITPPIMKGYEVWRPPSNTATKVFSGMLNSGNLSISLSRTPATGGGWNLIGNPFPCAIDLQSPSITWTNIDKTVYYWNSVGGNYLSYVVNAGAGTGSRYCPAMQGFFVKVNENFLSGTFGVNNLAMILNAQGFYKDQEIYQNYFCLKATGEINTYYDKTMVIFNQDAKNGFDNALDAYKWTGNSTAPQLYTKADSVDVCVNSMPYKGINMIIPLYFSCGLSGDFTLAFDSTNNFPSGKNIWIEDKKLHKLTEFSPERPYKFYYIAGDNAGRFVLHFKKVHVTDSPIDIQLSASDASSQDVTLDVYSFGRTVYVRNDNANLTGDVVIYNILGSEVFRGKLEASILNHYETHLTEGIYVVNVITPKATVNQKVVIR